LLNEPGIKIVFLLLVSIHRRWLKTAKMLFKIPGHGQGNILPPRVSHNLNPDGKPL
jgi:hypothetical protein